MLAGRRAVITGSRAAAAGTEPPQPISATDLAPAATPLALHRVLHSFLFPSVAAVVVPVRFARVDSKYDADGKLFYHAHDARNTVRRPATPCGAALFSFSPLSPPSLPTSSLFLPRRLMSSYLRAEFTASQSNSAAYRSHRTHCASRNYPVGGQAGPAAPAAVPGAAGDGDGGQP